MIDKLYGYRHDRCSVPELACELETDEEGVNSLKNSALDRLRIRIITNIWRNGGIQERI